MCLFTAAYNRGGGYYGGGDGSIWLDQVACAGYESNIFDCVASSIGIEDCTHNIDANVVCTTSKFVHIAT